MKKTLCILIFLLLSGIATSTMAADYASFQQDSVKAYKQYKKALALTSKADKQDKAIATLQKFVANWGRFADKYQNDPPQPFASLPDYQPLMLRPLAVAEQALTELKAGEVVSAHSTLEEVRYQLWRMRTVSGLVTLSDKVNDFHEVMEIVLDKMKAEKTAENYRKLGQRYGAWLEIKWEEQAGMTVFPADKAAFASALDAGRKAIAELRQQLEIGNIKAAKVASKKMKQGYKAIFFLDSCS